MRKTNQCCLLLAVLFSAAITTTLSAQNLNQEMVDFAKTWQDAHNRADADALTALYTGEVEQVNATDGSTSTVTQDQMKARFIQDFSAATSQIDIKVAGAELLPNGKARLFGTFSGTSVDKKTGEKVSWSGSYEHQAVKENGRWKLCQTKVIADK